VRVDSSVLAVRVPEKPKTRKVEKNSCLKPNFPQQEDAAAFKMLMKPGVMKPTLMKLSLDHSSKVFISSDDFILRGTENRHLMFVFSTVPN
jgi:hypothetical protein